MITFTNEENLLAAKLNVSGGWDHEDGKALRARIKAVLLNAGAYCCCHCRFSMHGWHKITIDTEHILPKGKFPQFTFSPINLDVSCKRCNMVIKGEDISFYVGPDDMVDPFKSEYYTIIHPNLDSKQEHLRILSIQCDNVRIVKYVISEGSAKGAETYRYFELEEIEIDTFDEAQGAQVNLPGNDLPIEFVRELREIIRIGEGDPS